MVRRIVYLDHSVLSQLAKEPSSPLLRDLTALVEADKALFPYSWTHHYEAELDSRLEDEVLRVGATLSRGLRFLPYAQIVAAQARRAYCGFVDGYKADIHQRDAFEHDPHGLISERWLDKMLHACVTTHPQVRERRRAVKELYAKDLSRTRSSRTSRASFDAARQRYVQEAVQFYFVNPQRRAFAGQFRGLDVPMLQFSGRVADEAFGLQVTEIQEMMVGIKSMFDFFDSANCARIPFIDIASSILASLELDESSRPYRPSDFYDVETWAAYLPYVDIAVADKNMHQVLSRRRLAARFGCRVFSNTPDSLRELTVVLSTGERS